LKILYLIWAPYNRRAESFGQGLECEVCYIHYFHYQKMKWSALKYPLMAVRTLWLLFRKRPDCVILMTPPLFAVLFGYVYCLMMNRRFLIDAHTGSLISRPWTYFRWLHRFLCRRAAGTIVTNEALADLVRSWGGRALIMNPPVRFPPIEAGPSRVVKKLVVVTAFSFDEPLNEILGAAREHPDIHFFITGNKLKAKSDILSFQSEHIHFTGFLPQLDYLRLLKESDGVLCLTTRDHTLQSGGEEALFMGKPLITSNFRILRDFFRKGTVYVDPHKQAISEGIRIFFRERKRLEEEMVRLREEYELEWKLKKSHLFQLLESGDTH
jgi:glycosyltransferase involved in cell wall biosynthesis